MLKPADIRISCIVKDIVTGDCVAKVAQEAAASKKRSKEAVAYAVALAAIISVESPFVHIDGITVRPM